MTLKEVPALLKWFRREGVDYPWGETPEASSILHGKALRPDSYFVWISEIMLQQTQVKAVIPYFLHWRQNYPDLKTLARAEEASVIRSWEGLGYYSRARNIHKTAKILVDQGRNNLPGDYEPLIKLPGIGPYTAAAILSISFGLHVPVMDANVKRLCQRWSETGVWGKPQETKWQNSLQKLMLDSGADPGEFNCALMQLGQLICKKGTPACESCPLYPSCSAGKKGNAADFPLVVKKNIKKWESRTLIYQRKGRILLEFRDKGIGKGLWSLPRISEKEPIPQGWSPEKKLKHRNHHFTTNREGLNPVVLVPENKDIVADSSDHRFYSERCEREELNRPPGVTCERWDWFGPEQLRELAVPAVYRRILEEWLSLQK